MNPTKKSQTIQIAADDLVKLIDDLKKLSKYRGCSIPVSRTWVEGLEVLGIYLDEVAPTSQSSEDEEY